MSYLQRHPSSGIYRFRRAVPPDLRQAIGRREIIESLGTRDPALAKRRAFEAAQRVQALFDEAARAKSTIEIGSASLQATTAQLPLAEINEIARRYRDESSEDLLRRKHARDKPRSAEQLGVELAYNRECLDAFRDSLRERQFEGVRGIALELLSQRGHYNPRAGDVALLCHALLRGLIEWQEAEIRRLQGDWPSLDVAPVWPSVAANRPSAPGGAEGRR